MIAMRKPGLAMMLPVFAAAVLGHAGAQAHVLPPAAGAPPGDSIGLRLADGTQLRIPCDKAAVCPSNSSMESASLTGIPRRAPLKRRSQVFDPRTPGAVASIRG